MSKYSTSITTLLSPRIELRFPIVIVLEDFGFAESSFTASWPEAELIASGVSEKQAIDNLKCIICAMFCEFENNSRDLYGRLAQNQKDILNNCLKIKNAV